MVCTSSAVKAAAAGATSSVNENSVIFPGACCASFPALTTGLLSAELAP